VVKWRSGGVVKALSQGLKDYKKFYYGFFGLD